MKNTNKNKNKNKIKKETQREGLSWDSSVHYSIVVLYWVVLLISPDK